MIASIKYIIKKCLFSADGALSFTKDSHPQEWKALNMDDYINEFYTQMNLGFVAIKAKYFHISYAERGCIEGRGNRVIIYNPVCQRFIMLDEKGRRCVDQTMEYIRYCAECGFSEYMFDLNLQCWSMVFHQPNTDMDQTLQSSWPGSSSRIYLSTFNPLERNEDRFKKAVMNHLADIKDRGGFFKPDYGIQKYIYSDLIAVSELYQPYQKIKKEEETCSTDTKE